MRANCASDIVSVITGFRSQSASDMRIARVVFTVSATMCSIMPLGDMSTMAPGSYPPRTRATARWK